VAGCGVLVKSILLSSNFPPYTLNIPPGSLASMKKIEGAFLCNDTKKVFCGDPAYHCMV
jgi:hypothetical protein